MGWAQFIWGSAEDGSEIIADYSANDATEALLKDANALADSLSK